MRIWDETTTEPVAELVGRLRDDNPRKIHKENRARLLESLQTYGQVEPIIANKRSGNIVGGHQRVQVAAEAGIKELSVVWVDLDEAEEDQLLVALNSEDLAGRWDQDRLSSLIARVREQNTGAGFVGVDPDRVSGLLALSRARAAETVSKMQTQKPDLTKNAGLGRAAPAATIVTRNGIPEREIPRATSNINDGVIRAKFVSIQFNVRVESRESILSTLAKIIEAEGLKTKEDALVRLCEVYDEL